MFTAVAARIATGAARTRFAVIHGRIPIRTSIESSSYRIRRGRHCRGAWSVIWLCVSWHVVCYMTSCGCRHSEDLRFRASRFQLEVFFKFHDQSFFSNKTAHRTKPQNHPKKNHPWLCPHTQALHMPGGKNPPNAPNAPNWPSKTGNPSGGNRDNNPPKPSAPPLASPLPSLAPASVRSSASVPSAPRGPVPPYTKK